MSHPRLGPRAKASPIAITSGRGGDQADDRRGSARRDALAISRSVQPTASTAPRNPATAAPGGRAADRTAARTCRPSWPPSAARASDRSTSTAQAEMPWAATPPPWPVGRRPGKPRPGARPTANSAGRAAAARCTPATLTTKAAEPSSSSDDTGIRGSPRAAGRSVRAGSANGTSTAITAVNEHQGTESPAPRTELGEQPARGGPEQMPTPHIADTSAEALVHNELRQCGIDDGITEARKQAAGSTLHRPSRPTGTPCSARCAGQRSRPEHAEAEQIRPPWSEPRRERVHRGGRDDRGDQVDRRHPRIEALATDLGDRTGQQADREEFVGRVQRDATGEQRRGAEVLRPQQLPPTAAGEPRFRSHSPP